MKNELIYLAISGDEVIAHILKSEKFGLVVIFLTEKLSLIHSLRLYNLNTGEIEMDEDLLALILSPFPGKIEDDQDLPKEPKDREDLSG